jgi:uncharacterized protein YcbK (DUF882 family)
MHRFTVSLWACLGALTLPHQQGHADARSPAARVESVVAKDESAASGQPDDQGATKAESEVGSKKGSDPGAKGKREGKKIDAAPSGAKKAGSPESGAKNADGAGPNAKKSPEGDGRAKAVEPADGTKKPASSTTGKGTGSGKGSPAWTRGQPGVVKLVRGSETLEVRVLDKKQHLLGATLPQFARFLRAKSGADHPIDARLVTLLATVSDHFGGRELNVVSGFRPYSRGQHARHSNHNEGRAIDFSIKGVANETVRDFCRTFRNVGVGYYPNSLFVHLDVRDENAYWVDYAAPGQAPRYRASDGKADDDDDGDAIASVDGGASEVARSSEMPRDDVARARNVGRARDRDVTRERAVFISR